VTRRIAKDEYLTYANCAPDERLRIVELRRLQDDVVRGQPPRSLRSLPPEGAQSVPRGGPSGLTAA
jgi:hypothetical protein